MHTKINSVPRDFVKYYKADTLEKFVSYGVAELSEVELFEEYAIKLIDSLGFKFLGWAIVKPQFLVKLAENNIGVLAIVKDQENNKKLIRISDDAVITVTKEDIDNLFSK